MSYYPLSNFKKSQKLIKRRAIEKKNHGKQNFELIKFIVVSPLTKALPDNLSIV